MRFERNTRISKTLVGRSNRRDPPHRVYTTPKLRLFSLSMGFRKKTLEPHFSAWSQVETFTLPKIENLIKTTNFIWYLSVHNLTHYMQYVIYAKRMVRIECSSAALTHGSPCSAWLVTSMTWEREAIAIGTCRYREMHIVVAGQCPEGTTSRQGRPGEQWNSGKSAQPDAHPMENRQSRQ